MCITKPYICRGLQIRTVYCTVFLLYHRETANAAFSTLSVCTACTLNGNKGVTLSKLFPRRCLPTTESVLVIHITYIKARLAIFALPKNHINYISVPKL